MHTEPQHKLVLRSRLNIALCQDGKSRLELPVLHVVFLHPHEGGFLVRLRIAVSALELTFLLFIFLQARQIILPNLLHCFGKLLVFRIFLQALVPLG